MQDTVTSRWDMVRQQSAAGGVRNDRMLSEMPLLDYLRTAVCPPVIYCSRKARAMESVIGLTTYCRKVRSLVAMITSAGMPGSG